MPGMDAGHQVGAPSSGHETHQRGRGEVLASAPARRSSSGRRSQLERQEAEKEWGGLQS